MKKIILTSSLLFLTSCATGKTNDVTIQPTFEVIATGNPEISDVIEETPSVMEGYKDIENLADNEKYFDQISLQEANQIIENGETAAIYYGSTDCLWCQKAVSVMNEAAKDIGITVKYVDVNEGTTQVEFDKLMDHLSGILKTDENGEEVMFIPFVIAVKGGEIVDNHLSLVESFELVDENSQLNEEQIEELLGIYHEVFEQVK